MARKSKKHAFFEKAEGVFGSALSDSPSITLSGTVCEIDNFKALLDFSSESIRINTSDGVVRIMGKNLEISVVTDENVSVRGKIGSLEFE